jgi:hypothetical protein
MKTPKTIHTKMPSGRLELSTGRRIGLSPTKRVVAGSNPASGSRCRGSSTVEQPPQGVIARRPLPICNFITTLAVTHGDAQAKAHAFTNLNKVCRIGTHLFHFAEYVNAMRGWGRGLRSAVGRWYGDPHQFQRSRSSNYQSATLRTSRLQVRVLPGVPISRACG